MKDKKKQIKEQLEKTLNLSKKLQEPRNDEEQQMLDNIMDEINKLNDYMDEISTLEGTDGKKYKHKNGMFDDRYPRGEITIYRAVDNHNYDEIREGDWVTTDERYAIQHNDMYFDGKGKIISMNVDGRDVLVSPTGNYEEAIYAPLKYSIDFKL